MGRFRVVLAFGVLMATAARATVFIPMSVEDLAAGSVAVVTGTVESLAGVQSARGSIYTLVSVRVDEVLRGVVSASVITLKEDGGTVGSHREVVFGTPSFEVGEHVLLFLSTRPDGSLRTNQLAQGKFQLTTDIAGMPRATRRFGSGTMVIAPPGNHGGATTFPLGQLIETLGGVAAPSPRSFRAAPLEATDPSLPREYTDRFMLLGPGRFFEADEGSSLSFVIDQAGDAILGLTTARDAVDAALAAWTTVPAATIRLQDVGLTADVTTPCSGPNKVRFNDPDGEIPAPVNCSGTLGVGGFCSDSSEAKTFAGLTFHRALRARLTLADGWQECGVWNACNVAEIATHEIGHSIGMGHSSENMFETDPVLTDATMFFRAHFDGRCAGVRSDDIAGITAIYPTAIPPTITTARALPDGSVFTQYHLPLAAIGGTGPYIWSSTGDMFPGLSVSADGVLSGTPTATTTNFSLLITATDGNGDSETRRFTIHVNGGQPACAGDCNSTGAVMLGDLVTGMEIALGHAAAARCPSLSTQPSGTVRVETLLKAVNNALGSC